MIKTCKALIACAASAAALCVAAVAVAQDAPAPAQRPGVAKFQERTEARQAERARALHDVLGIRPNQEAAVQAFQAAMRPERRDHGQPPAPAATTPERLDRMAARMAERQQAFQRRAEAIKRFYAQLTPEQQKSFDALQTLGHGGRGHDGHGFGDKMGGPPSGGPRGAGEL